MTSNGSAISDRCNYCAQRSVVRFKRTSYFSSRGHRRAITVIYQSCGEHENCVNWNAVRALYPDAIVERFNSSKWETDHAC